MGVRDLYSKNDVKFSLYAYIGIEYENISLKYIQNVFTSSEILIRKRYYIDDNEYPDYIVPDVFIPNLSRTLQKKFGLSERSKIILDYKRSIYAISPKDIQYLRIIPDAILIFCLMQEEGRLEWEKKIDEILTEMKVEDKEKKSFHYRIVLWSAKNEYASWMDKSHKSEFLKELLILENIKSIKNVENFNESLVTSITDQKNQLFKKLVLDYRRKFDTLQLVKHLVLLQAMVKFGYCTKQDILAVIDYSQPIVEDILKELLEAQIIKKKVFSEFLPHVYFENGKESPSLSEFFELSNQPEAKKGIELLVKLNKIPENLLYMTFEEMKTYYQIDKKHSIGTMFKICSLFEKEVVLTPEEVSIDLGINQSNMAELLRLMSSLGLVNSYKIEWEATIKYYSVESFPEPLLTYTKKYLPELLRIALCQIEKVTNIEIRTIKDIEKQFGKNWFSLLQEYGVLVKYKEEFPKGYTPEELIKVLRKEQLNQSFTKVRKRLAKLAKEKFKLLAIERENAGLVGKIERYYLPSPSNRLFSKQYREALTKEKQIENALKILKEKKGFGKEEIREILKDGWTSKLRVYCILQSNKDILESNITIDEGLNMVKDQGLTLSKTNFIRYLTPFSRTPLNLITVTRIKRGDNTPLQSFSIKDI